MQPFRSGMGFCAREIVWGMLTHLFHLFILTATPLTKAASIGESLMPLRPYTELVSPGAYMF